MDITGSSKYHYRYVGKEPIQLGSHGRIEPGGSVWFTPEEVERTASDPRFERVEVTGPTAKPSK